MFLPLLHSNPFIILFSISSFFYSLSSKHTSLFLPPSPFLPIFHSLPSSLLHTTLYTPSSPFYSSLSPLALSSTLLVLSLPNSSFFRNPHFTTYLLFSLLPSFLPLSSPSPLLSAYSSLPTLSVLLSPFTPLFLIWF